MSSDKVRIALVGCGYWGPKVIRAAASLSDVEVVALVDFREDLREALLRHHPLANSTATLAEALAAGPIDAVIVATNPSTHVEVASEAIEGGSHVMVEKPLALSAADCRRARRSRPAQRARPHGRAHVPVQPARATTCASLLESRELGEIYSIDSQRLNLGRVRRDVDAIWNFAPARHLDPELLARAAPAGRSLPRLRLPPARHPRPGLPRARVRAHGRACAHQLAAPHQGAADDGGRQQEDGGLRRRRRTRSWCTTPASTASGSTARSPTSRRSASSG